MAAERLQRLNEAKENIKVAQQKQKEMYDWKHANPKVYQVSSKVLKKDFERKKRKGGKMDAKFVGPFIITKNLGKSLYALQLVENPDRVIDRLNGIHLKPYLTPPPSPSRELSLNMTISPDHSLNSSTPPDHDHSLNMTISPDHDHSLNSTIPPDQGRSTISPDPELSPDLHDDTIPPLPPPMPPIDILIHRNAAAPVCDLADNSLSSIHAPGITTSSPISSGGFFPEFFPGVLVAPSPVVSHLPAKPNKPLSTKSPSKPKKPSSTKSPSKPKKPPSNKSPSKPKKPPSTISTSLPK